MRTRNNYFRKLTTNEYIMNTLGFIWQNGRFVRSNVAVGINSRQRGKDNFQLARRKFTFCELHILMVIIWRCRFTFKIQLCEKYARSTGKYLHTLHRKFTSQFTWRSTRNLGFCDKWQTCVVASGKVVKVVKCCDEVRVELLRKKRRFWTIYLRHL